MRDDINEVDLMMDLKCLSLEDVCVKYGVSLSELFEFQLSRNFFKGRGGVSNIVCTGSGKFAIKRVVNGEYFYYGSYGDRDEAEAVVLELRECGWDKEMLPDILLRLGVRSKCER